MSTQPAISDAAPSLAQLQRVAELALARHSQARAQTPERAAAAYLRAALASARVMARHAPQHPALWRAALTCIEHVTAAAQTAEAALFAAGKNSASYFAILIAAESLRLTIADKIALPPKTAPSPRLSIAIAQGNHHKEASRPTHGINVLDRRR